MKLRQIVGTPIMAKIAPTIAMRYYNGRVIINAPSCELLSLKPGNSIAFFQDEHNPKDWYFTKSTAHEALKLKAKGKGLMGCNGGVVRDLMRSVNQYDSITFYTSEEQITIEGHNYWQILTDKTVK